SESRATLQNLAGGRESVPAQAAGVLSRAQGQAPACRQSDPADAGAAKSLVQLARRIDHRPAQDLRHLAPQGLPPLLALEVRSWPAAPTLSDGECNRSVFSGLEGQQPEPGKFPTEKLGENQFTSAIQNNGGLGHQAFAQYFHVFQNRVCYEFELGVVGSADMTESKKNEKFRVLKAILATVKFYATTVAPHRLKSFIHHLETERSGSR